MKKLYLILFPLLFSACSLTTQAKDCYGNIPAPNKEWQLLSKYYTEQYTQHGGLPIISLSYDYFIPDPKNLDASTVISSKDNRYYKDKNGVYLKGNKIIDACPNSFEVLSLPDEGVDPPLSTIYSKDTYNVFLGGKKIENADARSFVLLGSPDPSKRTLANFAKDKNSIYSVGKKIPFLDVNSFEVIDRIYSKDKNFIYITNVSRGSQSDDIQILKDAGPETFQVGEVGSDCASDGKNFYKLGEKVNFCSLKK